MKYGSQFKGKKLLMVHADDAGLCHDENKATIAALKAGIVTSYSIMVPCEGFEEIADFARNHPEYDYGIHLSLTCEWKNRRFGPVSDAEKVKSLTDDKGHFFPKRELLASSARLEEVETELSAQIEKALNYGLRPSHLDSHMYSVGCRPDIFQLYKDLGKKYDLPVLLNRSLMKMVGLKENLISTEDKEVDQVLLGSFEDFQAGTLAMSYRNMISNLSEGLCMIIIHPAFDTHELQEITEDHPNFGAEWRQVDFDVFTDPRIKELLNEDHVELVDWKSISSK